MAAAAHRLSLLAGATVFVVAGFLAADTVATIRRVGLTGTRPPLPVLQTILRVLIAFAAPALWRVFHDSLERLALLIAAAAAASTALYGFGLRSAGLSAFRLLSHLAAYALIMLVAGRRAGRSLSVS